MSARRYNAYLVRHWSLPDGAERIEIQHVQSGESARVRSLQATLDWIGQRSQERSLGECLPERAGKDGEEVAVTDILGQSRGDAHPVQRSSDSRPRE
jgi:hypothetical protein